MKDALSSDIQFREAYRQKLDELLRAGAANPDGGLAAFILACANAYFDQDLLSALRPELESAFARLREQYAGLLARGRVIDERYAEDLLVFLKMGLIGLDNLKLAEHRQVAWWRVQFNHIRSFRPQRSAARPVASIHLPFNPGAFHYTRELCQRESFWKGDLEGKPAYLLYNKYPFARMHALLIPEPEKRKPQFLERACHAWVWRAAQQLGQSLPGFGVGYNALGTFASVNHLHFQSFIEPRGMPATWSIWRHNGGSEAYPTDCQVFDSWEESWEWIERIHTQDASSYNLLYTPGRVFCFERRRQGTYKHARWTSGFAWFEASGNLITFSREDFNTITFEKIEREFKKIRTETQPE